MTSIAFQQQNNNNQNATGLQQNPAILSQNATKEQLNAYLINNSLVQQQQLAGNSFARSASNANLANQQQQQYQFSYQYSYLENQLMEAVKNSLRNEMYANASFLCERLHAEVKNEDVKLLLAECYLGEGKAYKAYEILKNCISPSNRYKFALTCMKLNKLNEAEKEFSQMLLQIPNGAAGLFILGQICERTMKKKEALDFYQRALKEDPTMWVAFERLSKLQQHSIDPSLCFNDLNPNMQRMNQSIKDYMLSQQQWIIAQSIGSTITQNNPTSGTLDNLNEKQILGGIQQSPSHSNSNLNIQTALQQQQIPNQTLLVGKPPSIVKSPSNQDMKENLQLSAKRVGAGVGGSGSDESLNSSNTIINNNNNISQNNFSVDEDNSYSIELKTPTGQSSSQYATPISNIQLPQKRMGQNAPQQQNQHQSRIQLNNNNNQGTNNSLPNSGLGSQANNSIVNQLNFQLNDSQLPDGPAGANQAALGGGMGTLMSSNNTSGIGEPIIIKPFTISTPNLNNMQNSGNQMLNQANQMSNTPISGNPLINQSQTAAVSSFETSTNSAQRINRRLQQQQQMQQQQQIHSNQSTQQHPQSLINPFLQSPSQPSSQATQNNMNGFIAPTPLLQFPSSNQAQQHHFTLQSLLQSTQSVDIQDLTSLLRVLGHGYQQLCYYKCQEAIKIFGKLPKKQYQTGWVQQQIGKCFFEMNKYQEAEKVYKKMMNIESWRLEGLDYLSSCLWHMRKQMELTYLSNYVLERSLFAPETWCVVGNCYSLQKEHETALKYFERAIQLNPNYAYAHTLSGHEYVANEDFEQARKCFQKALNADDRHYNAWWGLGNISLKQEKFDQAMQFFNTGLQINSRSVVLNTYMGLTMHSCQKSLEALKYFEQGERIDPQNQMSKFQKASVLLSLDRYEEALQTLIELQKLAPREAPIYVQLGRIYKRLGNTEEALKNYMKALDLDPKDSNMVKSIIDKIHSSQGANGSAGLGGGVGGLGVDLNDDGESQMM